jgi:chromosome segregation ATPase
VIPLGNWEETNDELRNEIADLEGEIEVLQSENRTLVIEKEELQSALNAADTDIADYLFELDHIHRKNEETEQDIEGLLLLVEYWQEKAARVEAEDQNAFVVEAQIWRRQAEELGRQNDELRNELDAAVHEANREWGRANTLETYSISIEESRELTNRNLELEQELGAVRNESAKAQLQVRELERENNELRSQLDESDRLHGELDFLYRNLLDSHIELKKALGTLSE